MDAADTIISFSSYTIKNSVDEDLMLLKTLLDENKLSFNVTKTQSLLIESRCKMKALEGPASS